MRRAAAALLVHVNLLLAVIGGATLATAARLKWDPSAYVPLRAFCPREYAAAAAALAAGGAALLLAAHLAAAALALPHAARARRPLLLAYAAWQMGVWGAGWAWGAWCARQGVRWLCSEEAARAVEVAQELQLHLRPLLALLARFHPLPDHIADLMQEAEEDAPRNLYVAGAVLLLTALLLPAAALLALAAARRPPPPPPEPDITSYSAQSTPNEKSPLRARAASCCSERPAARPASRSTPSEKSPLRARAAYRGGRLVLL